MMTEATDVADVAGVADVAEVAPAGQEQELLVPVAAAAKSQQQQGDVTATQQHSSAYEAVGGELPLPVMSARRRRRPVVGKMLPFKLPMRRSSLPRDSDAVSSPSPPPSLNLVPMDYSPEENETDGRGERSGRWQYLRSGDEYDEYEMNCKVKLLALLKLLAASPWIAEGVYAISVASSLRQDNVVSCGEPSHSIRPDSDGSGFVEYPDLMVEAVQLEGEWYDLLSVLGQFGWVSVAAYSSMVLGTLCECTLPTSAQQRRSAHGKNHDDDNEIMFCLSICCPTCLYALVATAVAIMAVRDRRVCLVLLSVRTDGSRMHKFLRACAHRCFSRSNSACYRHTAAMIPTSRRSSVPLLSRELCKIRPAFGVYAHFRAPPPSLPHL